MKNHKGFSAVEGLLILVIVGILGFVGWYVWHSQSSANKTLDNASKANTSVAQQKASDLTAKWTAFSSTDGKYSLKHPQSWVTKDCGGSALAMAASRQYLGTCDGSTVPQIMIVAEPGDSSKDMAPLASDGLTSKASVKIDSVTGTRYELTVPKAQELPEAPAGTKVTEYIFYTNSYTYVFEYTQVKGSPNILSDFITMVTKTVKFTP